MKRISLLIVFFAALTVADVDEDDNDENCPTILTKRQWGGRTAVKVPYQIIPVPNVIIHHTVSQTCDTKSSCATIISNIQNHHMNELDFDDIGYNFLIGNDGLVYEGAGWHVEGAHTYHWNKKSIGIAFVGDFSSELPSLAAIESAKKLIKCGVEKGEIARSYSLYGARQLTATESPGIELYGEIQGWDNWTSTL
ncbi:hypothetical protein HA402_013211 [Bradysia odoriphaga]|nr:hypothetical protein HA402_013211 [Bradysia odoriphaga]